jgi:phage shock protein PspC (stress-responsive transcriptional regulator)
MKKTISINVAGLIFYIEEDGYDKLRQYLTAVHRYFSSFADSTEIVADIESRIAERFLIKQKEENKQAISIEDVEELIKAMGSVSDFEAVEQAEDLLSEPELASAGSRPGAGGEERASVKVPPAERIPRGRFYRDLKRKILGGVAAGIAHYYAMDPLWVRLLLLLGIFGMVPISGILGLRLEENFAFLSGVLLIGYVAMWIAFPGSRDLEDNLKVKKFYRDPEHKVLGGVAAGLSSYFNVDMGVIRFIWVISIFFFGTGLLAYIILWAIAPAAKTLTEKMEMQGEPITLFNIDSNIKRNLEGGATDPRQGADLRKLLLLPFTILATILNALGRVFRELGPVIRVLVGIAMVAIGAMGVLSLLIFGAALLGLASLPDFGVFPPEFIILKDMPALLIFSVATLLIVPVLVVLFLGLMLLLKRRVVGSTAWIVMAGLFIFSLVGAVSSGLIFQRNFSETADYVNQRPIALGKKMLTLDGEDSYNGRRVDVSVFLTGWNSKDSAMIRETYFAQGPVKSEARAIASKIEYKVEERDSVLFFADGPLKSETLPYRNQHIEVNVQLPYHEPFAMTRNFFFGRLDRHSSHRKNLEGKDIHHRDLNWSTLRWAILPDSGLVCLNFPQRFILPEEEVGQKGENWSADDTFNGIELGKRGEFVKQFAVTEFNGVDLGGAFHVLIKKGDTHSLTVDGSEANVEAIEMKIENGLLSLEPRNRAAGLPEPNERIGVVVTVPVLESVQLSGATMARIEGFDELARFSLKLAGATRADLRSNQVTQLDVDLSGASKLFLAGKISDFRGDLSGSCLLKATESTIKNAEVSASGVSQAILGNVENLTKKTTFGSKVSHFGE